MFKLYTSSTGIELFICTVSVYEKLQYKKSVRSNKQKLYQH